MLYILRTITVINGVIVGICITLCSNGWKINNSPQETVLLHQLIIYLCIYQPSNIQLSIYSFSNLTRPTVATVTFPQLSRWYSHSSQCLHILSVTREIPILALSQQQPCDSRLFQWKGIPPYTHTYKHTHTHTQSYIFIIIRCDSISHPVEQLHRIWQVILWQVKFTSIWV